MGTSGQRLADLVPACSTGGAGCPGRSWRRRARAREAPCCRSIPAAFRPLDNDAAVGLSQMRCQTVQVVGANIVDPAVQPLFSVGALTVAT